MCNAIVQIHSLIHGTLAVLVHEIIHTSENILDYDGLLDGVLYQYKLHILLVICWMHGSFIFVFLVQIFAIVSCHGNGMRAVLTHESNMFTVNLWSNTE